MTDPRRRLPGVDRLLESDAARELLTAWPRERVVDALREAVDAARRRAVDASRDSEAGEAALPYVREARRRLEAADRPSLRRVLNATGVVLHTNLGRAPLAPEAREAMARAATGYSNLEYDLDAGERGSRYVHCAALLRELTGAEDGLVVNNCAAGLVLALVGLARGGRVLVSRGELVEIGGGFRIPAMLERAGARLGEVGSTNRTRPADYLEAAGDGGVAAILKVHRSNFRMTGFVEEAGLDELVDVARELGVPLVHDLGSGLLTEPGRLGLPDEPRPADSVAAGADVVCFSGDKLLGGPQAGLIVGRSDAVEALRSDPLCRALRVDKVTLAGLEATLALHRDPETAVARIPALAALAGTEEELESRARELARRLSGDGLSAEAVAAPGRVGGGTYPGVELPGWAVRIQPPAGSSAGALADALREGELPVVGRVEDDRLLLHLRTVAEDEEEPLVDAVLRAVGGVGEPGDG